MRRYLALEGGEGSGKTTVAAALAGRLGARGEEVVVTREPGGTTLGEAVRALVLDSDQVAPWAEAFLFAAQRAQLVAEVVAPALARGAWVISDRSYYSSLAYQGHARALGVEKVREVNELGLGRVLPDYVFVLDVEPGTGLGRQVRPDRIGGEGLEFQEEVRWAYAALAVDEPGRVFLVSADGGVDAVVDRIMATIGDG